mmetsp:Transcript_15569/g.31875  ORF Transcript_15569/g.31875 Transcript_15569/m.31875 type:complete len:164 (-) Transcript_15569:163-654(-)
MTDESIEVSASTLHQTPDGTSHTNDNILFAETGSLSTSAEDRLRQNGSRIDEEANSDQTFGGASHTADNILFAETGFLSNSAEDRLEQNWSRNEEEENSHQTLLQAGGEYHGNIVSVSHCTLDIDRSATSLSPLMVMVKVFPLIPPPMFFVQNLPLWMLKCKF